MASVERWSNDSKENLHPHDFTLTGPKEYRLTTKKDFDVTSKARINCDCGKLFTIDGQSWKVSDFALLETFKSCQFMKIGKEIKKNHNLLT